MPKFGSSFMVALVLLGCGSKVNLGQDSERWTDTPPAKADPDAESVVYEGRLRVVAFTVDDADLSLLLENPNAGEQRVELVTCPVDHCETERRTLFSAVPAADDGILYSRALIRAGDYLYWLDGHQYPFDAIVRCSISGCPDGPERLVEGAPVEEFIVDADSVYWLRDNNSSVLRVVPGSTAPAQLLYRFPYDSELGQPFLIQEHAEYLYLATGKGIVRLRKDGSAAPERVAAQPTIGGMHVSAEGVYFTTRVLTGALLRCPLSGCVGRADELVTGQRWPSALYADSEQAYWINAQPNLDQRAESDALLTVSFRDGVGVRPLAHDFTSDPFGVNERELLHSSFAVSRRVIYWREASSEWRYSLRSMAR